MQEFNLASSEKQDELLSKLGPNQAVYNKPGTYSWKVPEGVKYVYVTIIGAGGGGGGGSSTYFNDRGAFRNCGRGGGGGGPSTAYIYRKMIYLNGDTTVPITIGKGGKGGSGGDSRKTEDVKHHEGNTFYGEVGGNGGITSFGKFASISGGSGGNGSQGTNSSASYSGGKPGRLSNPKEYILYEKTYTGIEFFGEVGKAGDELSSTTQSGQGSSATDSTGYGAGGSGGGGAPYKNEPSLALGGSGGNGSGGLIIIEW